jgi:hypothetical protein
MFRSFCVLLLAVFASIEPGIALAANLELEFEGLLVSKPRGKEPVPVAKFSVFALTSLDAGEKSGRVFWLVEDDGSGWAWPESFGDLAWKDNQKFGDREPQILYTHNNLPSPVALPKLVVPPGEIPQAGKKIVEGRNSYERTGTETYRNRECLKIEVSTNFGRAAAWLVEADTGILMSAKRKLFLGQGDEFELTLELKERREPAAETLEKLQTIRDGLNLLQTTLERTERDTRPELTSKQLTAVAAALPVLDKLAENTPFHALAVRIQRDYRVQSQRVADVSTLSAEMIGKKIDKLTLVKLNGEQIPAADLEDKILVLHFWKYHEDPLREPYGQVGYLDFLEGKRGKLGVKFVGVAVDPKLGDPATGDATLRAIKKLVSFMNLGYDIAKDNGSLLETFGDPRQAGAELPLWVVVDPNGKIVHYKAGFYQVNPRDGLQELDDILVEQIKAKRAAAK